MDYRFQSSINISFDHYNDLKWHKPITWFTIDNHNSNLKPTLVIGSNVEQEA